MKPILKIIPFILFFASLAYLVNKLMNIKSENSYSIEFQNNSLMISNAVQDTLYHFNALVNNNTSNEKEYSVFSTCGCTILPEKNRSVKPNKQDTVKAVINTYGKHSRFTSTLILYDKQKTIKDTMLITIDGFKNN